MGMHYMFFRSIQCSVNQCAHIVVVHMDKIWLVKVGRECRQNWCAVPGGKCWSYEELVALQDWAANRHDLGDRKTIGEFSRKIAALDPDGVAPDNPILTRTVVVRTLSVERPDVRITPEDAASEAPISRWRRLWRRGW